MLLKDNARSSFQITFTEKLTIFFTAQSRVSVEAELFLTNCLGLEVLLVPVVRGHDSGVTIYER